MKKVYIHNAASISALGFSEGFLVDFQRPVALPFWAAEPNYQPILPIALLRRMSKITRMSLMCALTISERENPNQWDAILTATGLGNLADTEKFIQTYISAGDSLIAPTAFTQSSHNTIAGQIALILKNTNYNLTYVQQAFSLESALLDAKLQIQLGKQNILVGAADEKIPLLNAIAKAAHLPNEMINEFGEGATFLHLSAHKSDYLLRDVQLLYNVKSVTNEIETFLETHQLRANEVLTISANVLTTAAFCADIDATKLCGRYFTNNAFALHVGLAGLAVSSKNYALVMQADGHNNLGLILVSRA